MTLFGFLLTLRYYPTVFWSTLYLMLNFYQTHRIFAFHPSVAGLHDVQVTFARQGNNLKYPALHPDLLRAHFETSVWASMSAAAEPLAGDDEDETKVSSVLNDAVKTWANDSSQWPPNEWSLDTEGAVPSENHTDMTSPGPLLGCNQMELEIAPRGHSY